MGRVRLKLRARGVELPPWENTLAHTLLDIELTREVDSRLAIADYIINCLIVATGVSKERFEGVSTTLASLRDAAADILYERVYDPSFIKLRNSQKKLQRTRDMDLLKKVSELSKDS